MLQIDMCNMAGYCTVFAVKRLGARMRGPSLTTYAGVSLLLCGSLAIADDTASKSAPDRKSGGIGLIEEVVVTATKRDANLRDIPISIDSFRGEDLREIGATDSESIAKFAPGVTTTTGPDPEAVQIVIRGISTGAQLNYFNRTFGIFYDDISLVNPSLAGIQPNFSIYDMRSVEILKGPQGTLFGGSALAGAVRYVPAMPDLDEPHGSFAASIGEHARSDDRSQGYDLMWNQPLTDHLAARIVGSKQNRPGYINDTRNDRQDTNETESTQYRAIVSWDITDRFSLDVNAARRESQQNDSPYANYDYQPVHDAKFFADSTDAVMDVGYLAAQYDFDDFYGKLILSQLNKDSYQRYDYSTFTGTSQAGIGTYNDSTLHSEQPSAELRLVSTSPTQSRFAFLDSWNYIAGYFYTRSDQGGLITIGTAQTSEFFTLSGDVLAEEHAIFFDVSRTFFEKWELGLGGRYFRQTTDGLIVGKAKFGLLNDPLLAQLMPPIVAAGLPDGAETNRDQAKISDTVFNPKVTLQYRFSDNLWFFASAIKGFRYAGLNTNVSQDPEGPLLFDSDHIWNYELGVRSEWFGGALQVDLTAFHIDWTDLQINQLDYLGVFGFIKNIGEAENTGAELSVTSLLPGGLALKMNAAYIDAHTTVPFDDYSGEIPAGRELPLTSPWSASAILLWYRAFSHFDVISSLSYTYQNRNYNNLAQTYEHPALSLLGASLKMDFPQVWGQPAISLIGTNLT
uniref:TonB-dependent receptor n=2 Tax=Litorivivens sp. TaxID=2020868 RepID=UPI003569D3CC